MSLTLGTTTTTDPSAPDFYLVTATVTTPGYSGSGSNYLIINALPTPSITWATPAPITVGTPLSATQLDATANTPGTFTYSIPAGTVLAVGSYPITVNFVATDTADFSPNASKTVTLVVQANTQSVTPVNFNTVNVGTTSSAQTVTFTFINPVTLGSTPVAVLTQGVAGLDFKNTNGGNCAAGAYAANATCTVTVNFTPGAPGPRLGSVVLLDALWQRGCDGFYRRRWTRPAGRLRPRREEYCCAFALGRRGWRLMRRVISISTPLPQS